MVIWEGLGGYRYSTPPDPTRTHHPGYTPALPGARYTVYRVPAVRYSGLKMVVGLISVRQLSLSL